MISRGNRNFENYFINGRYIKSGLIAKSIEEAYKSFVMQHKFPFTVLHISINGDLLDVNVHPTKMELRFSNGEAIYQYLTGLIRDSINQNELVYQVSLEQEREEKARQAREKKEQLKSSRNAPEPFERNRLESIKQAVQKDSPYEPKYGHLPHSGIHKSEGNGMDGLVEESVTYAAQLNLPGIRKEEPQAFSKKAIPNTPGILEETSGAPLDKGVPLEEEARPGKLLEEASRDRHKIIGQLFETYWLVEFDGSLYIIDQHAAHEKVLYERTMAALHTKEFTSQVIYPPILLTLNMQEEALLKKYMGYFQELGYEIGHFGGKEYSVTAVPANLFGLDGQGLVIEILDSLANFHGKETPQMVTEKIASMSCKAAVKGNQALAREEIESLIGELLTLENPYHCPHGRPTIISMSKHELEKKFKRVVS